jgi:hypothetical protein
MSSDAVRSCPLNVVSAASEAMAAKIIFRFVWVPYCAVDVPVSTVY